MEVTTSEIKQIIRSEIGWVNSHEGMSGEGEMFEEGFACGLRQALFLINKIEHGFVFEDLHVDTV